MNTPSTVPAHLRSTYILLKRAFPTGIPTEEYLPLLAVMQETGMSNRSVADALVYYSNDSYNEDLYIKYLYEVSHVMPNTRVSEDQKERIIEKLEPFGFDQWKDED